MAKPILVTGAHRSGSTWVGRMLAHAPGVAYIHEPFSVSDPPSRGVCSTRFKYWFTYISDENEHLYYKPLKRMLELRYDLAGALRDVRSVREFESTISEFRRFLGYRIKRCTPLVKDPIAFFSAAWMSKKLGMSVVMLIRHPAAFVSSVKKLNWQHPFSHFLEQKLLMEKMLGPFESEIRAYAERQTEIIDQAILLWRMIHHTVLEYKKAHGDWIFVRHEDLSLDPVREFRILCGKLGLEFSSSTEDAIQNYSGPLNPQDPDAPVGSEDTLKRDSRMNIRNWKNRLSLNEIEKIRNKVEDISRFFYSDSDWK